MASWSWGGVLEALVAMARPQPNSPPLTTVVPGGAVAARAAPRVRAVLSPSTTSDGGWASCTCTWYRLTLTAAVAGTPCPPSPPPRWPP